MWVEPILPDKECWSCSGTLPGRKERLLRDPLQDSEPIVEGVLAEGTDPGQDNPEAVGGVMGLETDGTASAPDVDDSEAFDV